MADRDLGVGENERDAATDLVKVAFTAGRIVEADRDKRLQELRYAQTLGEIQMLTHDLAPLGAPPLPSPQPAQQSLQTQLPAPQSHPPAPPPHVNYGPAQVAESAPHVNVGTSNSGRGCGLLVLVPIVIVVIGIVVTAFTIFNFTSGVKDAFDGIDIPSGVESTAPVDVFTADGYEGLLSGLDAETGSTTVFDAVLYPSYAVMNTPAEPAGGRANSYYYDGELKKTSQSRSTYRRFDLASIDPAVVIKLVNRARSRLVENPTASYVIIRAPQDFDDGAWIYAYASNDFSEGGYLAATKNGKIVRRVTY